MVIVATSEIYNLSVSSYFTYESKLVQSDRPSWVKKKCSISLLSGDYI
jgi:hypothetical protein